MSNLEERMAEITRRSENMIKMRRQQKKHMLMACIPVVLCAGMSVACLLSGWNASDSAAMDVAGQTHAAADNSSWNGSAMTVKSVTVSGAIATQIITEPSQVQQIGSLLQGNYLDTTGSANADGGATTEDIGENDPTRSEMYSAAAEFIITLTMDDGSASKYCLAGNRLMDLHTGHVDTLKNEQMIQLKALLGILPQ